MTHEETVAQSGAGPLAHEAPETEQYSHPRSPPPASLGLGNGVQNEPTCSETSEDMPSPRGPAEGRSTAGRVPLKCCQI